MTAIVIFDIDGVVRDVAHSYRRAIADTVEHFTNGAYRPSSADIDRLKSEGIWNNDWEASQEFIYRYFEGQEKDRTQLILNYDSIITFFQARYLGIDSHNWNGYIRDEKLLLQPSYLADLSAANIFWGFFSGAPHVEAAYILEQRLGLASPVLIGMEDAPGKPDPTGLLAAVQRLEQLHNLNPSTPVIYVGDTVADMYTVDKARLISPNRHWAGVGILPPHIQTSSEVSDSYANILTTAGATAIFNNVQKLNVEQIQKLVDIVTNLPTI